MALPVYQATGTVVESASGNVTPAWPAHQADDIGILVVEEGALARFAVPRLANDAGFRPLPWGSSVKTGNGTSAARTHLCMYWCRATSGAMPSPTVQFTEDHVRAVIVTLRGCTPTGNPWNAGASGIQDADQTSVSIPGLTTTAADCLVLGVVASARATVSAFISGWTNASLATVTERLDSGSTIGSKDGSHFGIFTGTKAVAGAVSATTATLAAVKRHVTCQIAFTGTTQPEDLTPWPQNCGPVVESASGDITVPWPDHEIGDLALLIAESNTYPHELAVDRGFTEVVQQSNHTSGDVAAVSICLWYKIAASAVEAAPVVDFKGNHIRAQIITFRGHDVANPFNIVESSASVGTVATYTAPADSTLNANTLQVCIVGHGNDNEGMQNYAGSPTNADLKDLHIFNQGVSSVGAGSGLAVIMGKKEAIGAYATTTGSTGETQRNVTAVLMMNGVLQNTLQATHATVEINGQELSEVVADPFQDAASLAITGQEANLGTGEIVSVMIAEPATMTITGQEASFSEGEAGEAGQPGIFWDSEEMGGDDEWTREL